MATEDATVTSAAEVGSKSAEDPDGALSCIRTAMHDSPATVVVLDSEGIIEYVNASFEEVSGYGASEVVGEHIRILSAAEELNELVWQSLSAGKTWRGEMKIRRRSGEAYDILASVQMVRDGDGGAAHFVSVGVDITEQKRAQEELAERGAYWRALVENTPDHILVVDKDGVIESLNHAVPGTSVDEVVGRKVYDFLHKDYRDLWRKALAEVFAGGRPAEFEVKTAGDPRGEQWYANRLNAVRCGDAVVATIVSSRNVTARKDTEEQMQAIATAISDVIVVVREGVLLEVLAPTKKDGLLPLFSEDLRGRRVEEFLPPAQAQQALEFTRETIATGEPREDEIVVDLPQGPTWLSARSAPVTLANGMVAAVVHILDITERKRLEEELQRLREEAEAQAEQALNRGSEYGLTFREITVLSLIARGKSDKEIAALLGLSPFTVNKHSSHLVRKLGSRSRSQAAARAVREGII